MTLKIKIYLAYFKIKFLNEIQYKIAAIAGVTTQFAWGGMYIMLYSAFLNNGNSSTYTIGQMATYIWLQQALFQFFNVWSSDKEIISQCETGDIAMELVRPVNLYLMWHAKTFGKRLAMVSLRAIPIFIVCTMPFMGQFKLQAPQSFQSLIFAIITLVFSIMLTFAYVMLMYISTIKAVTSRGIRNAFQMVLEFCSGSLIPLAFMPDAIVKVLKFTPFYYMQNLSFNIYNGYTSSTKEIIIAIAIQITWLTALTYIGQYLMKKQLSKLVVQGG